MEQYWNSEVQMSYEVSSKTVFKQQNIILFDVGLAHLYDLSL